MLFKWTRHRKPAGLLSREAETRIVWRVTDEQDGAVAEAGGFGDCMAHERRADPGRLDRRIDRQRPKQQRLSFANDHVPEPHRAGNRPESSRATKARPSDGLRPRRIFSDDFFLRFGPIAASSSASRAAMSASCFGHDGVGQRF
jgi:hypothetical protein